MTVSELQALIESNRRRIGELEDDIDDKRRQIADLNSTCEKVKFKKDEDFEYLLDRRKRYAQFENVNSNCIKSIGSMLSSNCTSSKIQKVMDDFDEIMKAIYRAILQLETDIDDDIEEIKRLEGDNEGYGAQIAKIEREEQERREREEREEEERRNNRKGDNK